MKRGLVQLVTACALASPALASADEPSRAPPETSYAYQTLIADSAAITMIVVGLSSNNPLLTGTAFGSYVVAAPAVHVAHARWGPAAGAFALRVVGVPLMGFGGMTLGMITCLQTNAGGECVSSGIGGAVAGLIAGAITASALDVAVLAREHDDAAPPSSRSRATVRVAPAVDPVRRSASLGLAGSF